jgi:hypothetical protein
MNVREMRQYEMLVRVRAFGVLQADRFPEGSPAKAALATIDQAVTNLTEYAVAQMAATRRTTEQRAVAREALLDALETISRTARVIAEREPGFQNTFQVPRRKPATALLTAGRLFARDAAQSAALFAARGVSGSFISELTALVERFEEAIRGRQQVRKENAAARARIDAVLSAGMAAVREIDVLVANLFREDTNLTAAWVLDRQVQYPKPGKAQTPAATPAVPVEPPALVERIPEPTPAPVSVFARKVS